MLNYCSECGKALGWFDKNSCKECGALLCASCNISLDESYCAFCAFEKIKTRKDELVKDRHCSACGKKVRDYTAIFCPFCGNNIRRAEQQKPGINK